jgi:hypothetical protein
MRSGSTAGFGRGVKVAKSWILYVCLLICLFIFLDDVLVFRSFEMLGGLQMNLYPLSFCKV